MGFLRDLFGRQDDKFDEQYRAARLGYDREKSISVLLDLRNNIEQLQIVAAKRKQDMAVWMAQKCCNNPIILCAPEELPSTGLRVVQGMILDAIEALDPVFNSDQVQGLYNIAIDGRCSGIVEACDRAITQLRSTNI